MRLMITSDLNRREWLKLAGGAGLASIALTSHAAIAAGGRPRQAPVANSPYSQHVCSLRPVGYWRLSETNGPTAFDSSGHANNGTYHGSLTFSEPGAVRRDANPAIGLDGRSYVEIPNSSAFSIGATGLTVQAWMRPTNSISRVSATRNTSTGSAKARPGPSNGAFAFARKTQAVRTESPLTFGIQKGRKEPEPISRNRSRRADGSTLWLCTNRPAETRAYRSFATVC